MNQDPALVSAFLRQGFSSYPAALDAIEYFETEIFRSMRRAFDEKSDWSKIRRALGPDAHPLPPKEGRSSTAARWLWSYVQCEKRGDDGTSLSLGICWNPPKQPTGSVVAYASFAASSGKPINVGEHPSRDPKIKIGSLDRNERRPFIVVDDQFDPDMDFRRLVDFIDVALPT